MHRDEFEAVKELQLRDARFEEIRARPHRPSTTRSHSASPDAAHGRRHIEPDEVKIIKVRDLQLLCDGFGPRVVGVAHDAAPEVISRVMKANGPRWAIKRPGAIHEELIG
jgi:hypothetical protein